MEDTNVLEEVVIVEEKPVLDVSLVTKDLDEKQSQELCDQNKITVDEINQLTLDNYAFSDLEKKIKPLKAKLKDMLIEACAKKAVFGKNVINITFQDRSTMNEDALVELLNEKGLSEYTMVIVKPDISRLGELLSSGQLTDAELKSCMIPNPVAVLKFPRRKATSKVVSTAPKETVADVVKEVVKENTQKRGMF